MSNPNHIYPLNDLKEHQLSASCWCEPAIDEILIVHNAADGREFIEEEERQAIIAGMRDVAAGRIVPLEEVRRRVLQKGGH